MNNVVNKLCVYKISNLITINNDISFNKLFKNLSETKTWISLIEHHPRIPALYGLPKIHKTNTTHHDPLFPALVVPFTK